MPCGHLCETEIQRRDICIHITESLCCTAETNTALYSIYTLIKIFSKTNLLLFSLKTFFFECSQLFNLWQAFIILTLEFHPSLLTFYIFLPFLMKFKIMMVLFWKILKTSLYYILISFILWYFLFTKIILSSLCICIPCLPPASSICL